MLPGVVVDTLLGRCALAEMEGIEWVWRAHRWFVEDFPGSEGMKQKRQSPGNEHMIIPTGYSGSEGMKYKREFELARRRALESRGMECVE